MQATLRKTVGLALGLAFACLTTGISAADAYENHWLPILTGPDDVTHAEVVEGEIRAHDDASVPKGTPWFKVIRGRIPVIITAPHASKPMRKGQQRFADRGTGALAALLHEVTGATVMYTT